MSDTPAILPETIQFDIHPKDGGQPYRVFLRKPEGDAPVTGWPTLYLLDANALIGTVVEALRVQEAYDEGVTKAVIVGIGYPVEGSYDSIRRGWDLSPPPGQTYPTSGSNDTHVRTGGAERFLVFIETELKSEIRRRLPINVRHQGLFGHSFGGLFVLYALFTRPEMFSHWIAASPSIGWEEGNLLRYTRRSEESTKYNPPHRVLITVAEHEQRAMIVDARNMVERLNRNGDFEVFFETARDETHTSVIPVAANYAIRFCFGSWIGLQRQSAQTYI